MKLCECGCGQPVRPRNRRVKDERVNSILRKNGYSVLRFWEHEVKKGGIQNCLKETLLQLKR